MVTRKDALKKQSAVKRPTPKKPPATAAAGRQDERCRQGRGERSPPGPPRQTAAGDCQRGIGGQAFRHGNLRAGAVNIIFRVRLNNYCQPQNREMKNEE